MLMQTYLPYKPNGNYTTTSPRSGAEIQVFRVKPKRVRNIELTSDIEMAPLEKGESCN